MLFRQKNPVNRKVARRAPLYWRSRSLTDWLSLSVKIFISILVFIGFYQLFFVSSTFKLKEVKISGDFRSVTEKNLLELAEIPYGKNLFAVNLYGIAKRIKRDPWLHEVQLRRKFPNGILIHVEEFEPVAVLEATRPKMEPNYYLVSKEGVIFKKTGASSAAFLPVVEGFEETKLRKYPSYFGGRTAEAFQALSQFQANPANRPFEVQKIQYHVTEGIQVQIRRKEAGGESARLYFGAGDFAEKLARWSRFVPVMTASEGPLAYRHVDLHVPGKIFARL